jgi:hypothetical protein
LTKDPPLDVRFLLVQSKRSLEEPAVEAHGKAITGSPARSIGHSQHQHHHHGHHGHQGHNKGGSSIIERVQYEQYLSESAEKGMSARRSELDFWTELRAPNPSISKLQETSEKMNSSIVAATAAYEKLLALRPDSLEALRSYAVFLLEVKRDMKPAAKYFDLADEIEESLKPKKTITTARGGQQSAVRPNGVRSSSQPANRRSHKNGATTDRTVTPATATTGGEGAAVRTTGTLSHGAAESIHQQRVDLKFVAATTARRSGITDLRPPAVSTQLAKPTLSRIGDFDSHRSTSEASTRGRRPSLSQTAHKVSGALGMLRSTSVDTAASKRRAVSGAAIKYVVDNVADNSAHSELDDFRGSPAVGSPENRYGSPYGGRSTPAHSTDGRDSVQLLARTSDEKASTVGRSTPHSRHTGRSPASRNTALSPTSLRGSVGHSSRLLSTPT